LHFEEVELHLVKWGIVQDYKSWNFHGERDFPFVPEQLQEIETVLVENEPSTHPILNDLVNDAYGIRESQDNQPMDYEVGQDHQGGSTSHVDTEVNQDKEYIRLKSDATRPLYPNCNKNHTKLYAMVGLQNLKSRFGLSGNSVTEILLWAKDLLPKDNMLPDNYSSMKNSLKGLGMKYKSIHACKYDCILYRKEHETKEKCPICNEPRYILKKGPNEKLRKFSRIPQKVLKYFPLGPRLKRLYSIPWIAEAMTWHARAEVGVNLMRHPIDSAIWKAANIAHPEFAKETRNVRLGLATDGFNPFGNLSTNQSIWPVILVPYNLPPSLCMRKEFSILSLLIPGPKAPGDDIDVFLAPLIDELNELWVVGVKAFDSNKTEEFILKAMLLWAIHDFPAYGTLSGCNVHGYLGCPICGEETQSDWLPVSKKICYHTHRRFLPRNHKFRYDKNNFFPDGIEERLAPKRLLGSQIELKAASAGHNFKGKHPKIMGLKRKTRDDPKDPGKMKPWSRRSMLFDLPYWKEQHIRHVLDVMHAEKNIIEHLIGTCLDGTHSKDGEKAREDLRLMNVRQKKSLWLKKDPQNGRTVMPDGAFTLTSAERKVFLDTLYELKVPTNFSSNLRRVVNYATHDLKQCKSHDWHVIMQLVPLLFKHCFSKHKELSRAIMQISLVFTLLCEKVVNRKHIMAAKLTLAEATCVLEKYFPPSFFDISIHLMVHLCDEALVCGPVRYRWMYPFERLMKTFKDYVKNTRYIGGSIAEEYITEEASLFACEYMPNPSIGSFNTCRERFIDESDEFADEEALGKGKGVKLTNMQYEQVARYVFQTHDDVDEWRE
jgi:hypothetical protein